MDQRISDVGYRGSAWECTRSTHNEGSCAATGQELLAPTILNSILGFSDAEPDEIAVRGDGTAMPIPKAFPRVRTCRDARFGRF